MRPRVHTRTIALVVVALVMLGLIPLAGYWSARSQPSTPLSTVLSLAAHHQIASAVIHTDGTVQVTTRSNHTLSTQKEPGQVLTPTLAADGARVSVTGARPFDATPLIEVLEVLLLIGAVLYITRKWMPRGGAHAAPGSTVSDSVKSTGITFNGVAGVDEAKAELAEIVEFLSAPERFKRIGARIPRGVLLSGPPGTGKTLLARAVAGEARVPFFSMSGSAFVELYVGVGAARVRELFSKARKVAPAIVFIDELDAVGGKRSSGAHGGNDEREHTLNQLLVEMDGFNGDSGVVVIAATNRPDMLDAALLRPGRFDRRVTLSTPDRAGRQAVLALHARHVRMEEAVDLDRLAGQTSGMAPADLANVINEAALLAARERRELVAPYHLDAALLRVMAGPELKSRVLSPQLKRVIAYHEVGHAVVMKVLPHCDPVAKVQAIARGNALGITVSMPKEDQYLLTRSALRERMAGLMGGRAAEELFFGEVTTGAQQDIQQANAIARHMVSEFGMSELGHISVGEGDIISPELAARIDGATRALVEEAHAVAKDIVAARKDAIAAIADHLCEVETIDGDALDQWLEAYPATPEITPHPRDDGLGAASEAAPRVAAALAQET